MKKLLIFCLTFCGILIPDIAVNAQNSFAPLGAEWWYQGNNNHYTDYPGGESPNVTWTDHVLVEKDTTINGINSRKLTVNRKYKSGRYSDSIFQSDIKEIYLYDNTDTVFVYNSNFQEFVPLYIFNVAVKDTIHLRNPLTNRNSDSLHVIIDSIVSENFDGQFLKSYYTKAYRSDTGSDGVLATLNYGTTRGITDKESTGKYTQNLGMTLPRRAGFFPYYTIYGLADISIGVPDPSGQLVCYKDNRHDIKLTDIACDSILMPTPGIKSLKQKIGITLAPNPARDFIQLEGEVVMPKGTLIKITDLTGRQVLPLIDLSGKQNIRVNLPGLSQGMYLLQIAGKEFYNYHKIIVQH